MREGFRTFDHTGDLGLIVAAETPERLHALAAEALLAQVAEAAAGPPDVRAELTLEGYDPRDLFVHWLNPALLEADLRRAVWTRVTVTALSPTRLAATLEGQRLDPARHTLLREIKAVSHHPSGIALGVMPGQRFVTREVVAPKGDVFLLLTDGFTEVFNASDEEFGMTRVEQIVAERLDGSLEAIADAVASAARAHGPQIDDQTLLLARFTGTVTVSERPATP